MGTYGEIDVNSENYNGAIDLNSASYGTLDPDTYKYDKIDLDIEMHRAINLDARNFEKK